MFLSIAYKGGNMVRYKASRTIDNYNFFHMFSYVVICFCINYSLYFFFISALPNQIAVFVIKKFKMILIGLTITVMFHAKKDILEKAIKNINLADNKGFIVNNDDDKDHIIKTILSTHFFFFFLFQGPGHLETYVNGVTNCKTSKNSVGPPFTWRNEA